MAEATVIVTASGPAPFLYSTVRAIAASVGHAREAGHAVEIVVVTVRPDAQTATLLRRAETLIGRSLTIAATASHNPDGRDPDGRDAEDCDPDDPESLGLARQRAIDSGTADLLFFHQAGDLVGSAYHARFLAHAAALRDGGVRDAGVGEAVLHPELVARFGATLSVTHAIRSDDPMFDPLSLIAAPVFSAMPMCSRAVVEATPMAGRDAGPGIGEDNRRWIAQTLGRGVPHLFVPETVGFCRAAPRRGRISGTRVMGRSTLFDPLTVREEARAHEATPQTGWGDAASLMRSVANDYDPLDRRTLPIRPFLFEAAAAMAAIEPALDVFAQIDPATARARLPPFLNGPALAWRTLAVRLNAKPKIAVFVDADTLQGADRVVPRLILDALDQAGETHQVLLIHRLGAMRVPWALRAEPRLVAVDVDGVLARHGCDATIARAIVARLFVQTAVVAIHDAGSRLFAEFAEHHPDLLRPLAAAIALLDLTSSDDVLSPARLAIARSLAAIGAFGPPRVLTVSEGARQAALVNGARAALLPAAAQVALAALRRHRFRTQIGLRDGGPILPSPEFAGSPATEPGSASAPEADPLREPGARALDDLLGPDLVLLRAPRVHLPLSALTRLTEAMRGDPSLAAALPEVLVRAETGADGGHVATRMPADAVGPALGAMRAEALAGVASWPLLAVARRAALGRAAPPMTLGAATLDGVGMADALLALLGSGNTIRPVADTVTFGVPA